MSRTLKFHYVITYMYCSPQFLCSCILCINFIPFVKNQLLHNTSRDDSNLLGHYIPGLVGEGILSESDEEFLRNLFPVEVT